METSQCSGCITGSVKPVKAEHAWTISGFSSYLKNSKPGDALVSPTFFIGGTGDLQGRLVLYPSGHDSSRADHVSVFLYLDSRERSEIRARLRCSLLNRRREELLSCRAVHEFKRGQGYGFPGFAPRSLLEGRADEMLADDSLVVYCAVSLAPERRLEGQVERFIKDFLKKEAGERGPSEDADKVKSSNSNGTENLKQLLDNEFSDVTLSSHGVEFRAHRQILAARSVVFSALFMRQTKESQSGRLELDELQPEVLKEMLRFVYTGKIDDLTLVPSLLEASVNFGLDSLKALCEQILFNTINLENVFGILMLADQYNVVQLKKHALNIISLYAKIVVRTPGFQALKDSKRTDLMAEAFCALALAQNM